MKMSKAYERRESALINRIAKDSEKLKEMQKGEVRGMPHHRRRTRKHHEK